MIDITTTSAPGRRQFLVIRCEMMEKGDARDE